MAPVFIALSGGRPLGLLIAGAIAFLILLVLIVLIMYPRRRD
jgi:high-affinity Fe2+/Pb2+ permease